MTARLRIGTRGSQLALWQANWVKNALEDRFPDLDVSLVIIKTKGDKIQDVPLAKVGGKGLFVKEIEEAILEHRVDLAVHSMKDMPANLPDGLWISAVPERENPFDALVSREGKPLLELPKGARIGTSSLRRSAQLKRVRPDLEIIPLRGNLDTRLKKLDAGGMDAVVLAAAGIHRMGFEKRITEYFDENTMMPAVGQGALCIESRIGDAETDPLVKTLDHPDTRRIVLGERAFLHRLEGGCQIPIAAHGRLDGDTFTIRGMVASLDGSTVIESSDSGHADQTERIGRELANALLAKGADAILDALKESHEQAR